MPKPTPRLTLVGAGPGDPDLITVKGVKALADAQVVLYDALVDKKLLDYAPHALKVFVGKRKGFKAFKQKEINEQIVTYALSRGHVVRLKGGDPFVYGRGAEEMEHARKFGIDVEVVSGISSSIAVPASLGIPVTQRDISRSFWVLTGTTSSGELSEDIKIASQSSATLVILMGMSKLSEIVAIYRMNGKSHTPIAVIQDGTRQNEKVGAGTVENILQVVEEKQLANPAIIVIGEVVRYAHQLQIIMEQVAGEHLLKIA